MLLTLLPSATLSQIRVSEGQQHSTKKAQRDGCCPATGAPLAASQLQGTAMYKCSRGRAALILFNRNTKQQIPSRGQNISELTLWHLYACFIFFFFFLAFFLERKRAAAAPQTCLTPSLRHEARLKPDPTLQSCEERLLSWQRSSLFQLGAQSKAAVSSRQHVAASASHHPSACGETEARADGATC